MKGIYSFKEMMVFTSAKVNKALIARTSNYLFIGE
jgi:hypothetical protein